MDKDAETYEDLEQRLRRLEGALTSEQSDKWGPTLRQLGLMVAEARQVEREAKRALERQTIAAQRMIDALRLWREAAE